MFKNLISFWKGKDFVSQVMSDFTLMLDHSENIYTMVTQALLENKTTDDLKDNVYKIDIKINKLQRSIRTRIVEHITLQPSINTNTCLCLMSVIKDAERIGDYTKNLYEVIELLDKPIDRQT